jgi:hypothetical protein
MIIIIPKIIALLSLPFVYYVLVSWVDGLDKYKVSDFDDDDFLKPY